MRERRKEVRKQRRKESVEKWEVWQNLNHELRYMDKRERREIKEKMEVTNNG